MVNTFIRFKWVVLFSIFIASLTLIWQSVCNKSSLTKMDSKILNKVSEESELQFPIDAKVVEYYNNNSVVDQIWVVKLIFDEKYLTEFMTSLLNKNAEDMTVVGALSESMNWWHPEGKVMSRLYMINASVMVNVIVSRHEHDVEVYIERAVF